MVLVTKTFQVVNHNTPHVAIVLFMYPDVVKGYNTLLSSVFYGCLDTRILYTIHASNPYAKIGCLVACNLLLGEVIQVNFCMLKSIPLTICLYHVLAGFTQEFKP